MFSKLVDIMSALGEGISLINVEEGHWENN